MRAQSASITSNQSPIPLQFGRRSSTISPLNRQPNQQLLLVCYAYCNSAVSHIYRVYFLIIFSTCSPKDLKIMLEMTVLFQVHRRCVYLVEPMDLVKLLVRLMYHQAEDLRSPSRNHQLVAPV